MDKWIKVKKQVAKLWFKKSTEKIMLTHFSNFYKFGGKLWVRWNRHPRSTARTVRVALAQDRINYFKMQVVLLHSKLLRLFWYFYQIWLFYSVSYYSRPVILNLASPGTRIFQTFHVRVHVHQTLELFKFWYHYMSRIKDLVVSCFGEILSFTWRTNSLQMLLYHWLSLLSSFIKNITV